MNHTILSIVISFVSILSWIPVQSRATTTHAKAACAKKAEVPYLKELQAAQLDSKTKQQMLHDWAHIYAAFLSKSATTKDDSKQWQALKQRSYIGNDFCKYTVLGQPTAKIESFNICLDAPTDHETADVSACHTNLQNAYNALTTNYLQQLHDYLSPTTFKIKDDKNGYKYNYATHHLRQTVKRFSQTNHITVDNMQPKTNFTGDVRDLGIIVNITNHSDTRFAIAQTGHKDNFIGTVDYGHNGVNLHTAALQHYDTKNTTQETSSIDRFTFYPIDPMNNEPILGSPLFTIRMYTGSEIKKFLQTLPHDREKNTFMMNGRPTSPEHLANDKDWYMLIVQHPTPQGQDKPNHDQRIQAINISTLKGPFLLNMQINEMITTELDPKAKDDHNTHDDQPADTTSTAQSAKHTPITTKIYQPSFSTVQTIQSPNKELPAMPLFILPKYLWTNPTINMYWMMISTCYIATITDFSFFGQNTFGSAFDYYEKLGYFDNKYWHRFIFDKYNLITIGNSISDAKWIKACAIYATNLNICNDIPSIYSAQNSKGATVANAKTFDNVNLQVAFPPNSKIIANQEYFNQNGINKTLNLPYLQLYTLIFSVPKDILRQGAFATIKKPQKNLYSFVWKDKKNQNLAMQTIYLDYDITKLNINFLVNNKNWSGTSITHNFKSKETNKEIKTTYSQKNNQHFLEAKFASPIDKVAIINTVEFNKYPLKDLYLDVYQTVNVSPYTRCYLFENGNLPKFLQNLTEDNWKSGIYLIPTIENNQKLSKHHPGALTVTFYKADKTILGSITTKGQLNNSSTQGILQPVKAYNLNSSQFSHAILEMYLSTGILIKYA